MQITRLQHYPAAQGYTHMRTHCRSPTEWTNRIPFTPHIRWNHIHFNSVFSGWVSAKSTGWSLVDQRYGASHISVLCFLFRHMQKYTRLYRNEKWKVTQERMQKKDLKSLFEFRILSHGDSWTTVMLRHRKCLSTGHQQDLHFHCLRANIFIHFLSTVDGFSCGKLLETD